MDDSMFLSPGTERSSLSSSCAIELIFEECSAIDLSWMCCQNQIDREEEFYVPVLWCLFQEDRDRGRQGASLRIFCMRYSRRRRTRWCCSAMFASQKLSKCATDGGRTFSVVTIVQPMLRTILVSFSCLGSISSSSSSEAPPCFDSTRPSIDPNIWHYLVHDLFPSQPPLNKIYTGVDICFVEVCCRHSCDILIGCDLRRFSQFFAYKVIIYSRFEKIIRVISWFCVIRFLLRKLFHEFFGCCTNLRKKDVVAWICLKIFFDSVLCGCDLIPFSNERPMSKLSSDMMERERW